MKSIAPALAADSTTASTRWATWFRVTPPLLLVHGYGTAARSDASGAAAQRIDILLRKERRSNREEVDLGRMRA